MEAVSSDIFSGELWDKSVANPPSADVKYVVLGNQLDRPFRKLDDDLWVRYGVDHNQQPQQDQLQRFVYSWPALLDLANRLDTWLMLLRPESTVRPQRKE